MIKRSGTCQIRNQTLCSSCWALKSLQQPEAVHTGCILSVTTVVIPCHTLVTHASPNQSQSQVSWHAMTLTTPFCHQGLCSGFARISQPHKRRRTQLEQSLIPDTLHACMCSAADCLSNCTPQSSIPSFNMMLNLSNCSIFKLECVERCVSCYQGMWSMQHPWQCHAGSLLPSACSSLKAWLLCVPS